MASRTSSMRVNDDPDGQVNLRYLPELAPEADMYVVDVVALGTMHAHFDTTRLPCQCEALRVRTRRAALCAGTCIQFTVQQPMKLVNCLNGNKWNK